MSDEFMKELFVITYLGLAILVLIYGVLGMLM